MTATCMTHAAVHASSQPRDLRDALSTAHWKDAMDVEYSALVKNAT